MRVIVCGSRRWRDRDMIADRLADLPVESTIVHGAAGGADTIAAQEAEKLGLLLDPHPAEWELYGKRAGYLRNRKMAELGADLVIAFWDGRSRGTMHMVDLAEEYGIPFELITGGME